MTDASSTHRRAVLLLAMLACCAFPGVAEAHVKWFCGPIDGSVPPVPLRQVISTIFLTGLAAFGTLIGIGAMIDAAITRLLPARRPRGEWIPIAADVVLRVGMAIYAVALWDDIAVVLWADTGPNRATGAVLTPELLHGGTFIGLLQLAIAACILVPRLSIVAAAGLLALYGIGEAKFGLFYMIDYLFFPGIALYVALGDPLLRRWPGWGSRLVGWRVPILTGSLAFSLMWTAVEKFLFPQWTIGIIVHHPAISFGFPFPTVTTIAGFVEFSLSFYLLVGRPVLVRVAAVLFAGVFVMAMPEFGMVDVVGHIPVLVILFAVLLHGETRLQRAFRGDGRAGTGTGTGTGSGSGGGWSRRDGGGAAIGSGGRVIWRYGATLAMVMALYYGLHAASIWTGRLPKLSRPSAAAAHPGPVSFTKGARPRSLPTVPVPG